MHPILFRIGPASIGPLNINLPFYSYGLMLAIAFLTALFFIRRDAAKAGLDPDVVGDMIFWCLPIGVVGTRIGHIIMFPSQYSWGDPLGWIAIWNGGLVFQGAIIPVSFFCLYYLRKHKVPFWKTIDVSLPYAILGHGIGRFGCFLKGCCYGARTELPWGVKFPRWPADLSEAAVDSPAYLAHAAKYPELIDSQWSYAVHPTQLYSVAALICICLALLYIRKKWTAFDGITAPGYFFLYGTYRFIVEFYRDDRNPTHFGQLSDQQVLCLVGIVAGVIFFASLSYMAKRASKPGT